MKIKNIAVLMVAAALLTSSCGDSEHFRIKGMIEGKPTMNLRVAYISDGTYVPIITAARDGEFELSGVSSYGTVVEICDYEYKLLGRTYAVNGEEISLVLSADDPNNIEAEGSDIAARWAAFLYDNADGLSERAIGDSLIANYVGTHPEDIVSTLLLITSYDSSRNPVAADSLLQLIEPQARPASLTEGFNNLLQRMVAQGATETVTPFHFLDRRDSIRLFRPSDAHVALLVFDNHRCGRADSIVPALKELHKLNSTRLQILEMSIDGDTSAWKRDTRMDTATWNQAWGAGGYGARGISQLAIPEVPYCVVCDSTGRQVLRTPSITAASDSVKAMLKKRL